MKKVLCIFGIGALVCLMGMKIIEEELPSESAVVMNVPLVEQYPELPRGCEVTSLAMLLQYSGYDVDKMELAENITYEPFEEDDLMGDMNIGFVGAMDTLGEDGLGVYVNPIIELAEQYVPSSSVKNITGKSARAIYKAIDKGYPVWVLTNARFEELDDDQFLTWKTEDGEMSVTYRQHSVVVTGYDENYVYINDPMQSETYIAHDREDFEAAWVQMGSQAMYLKINS